MPKKLPSWVDKDVLWCLSARTTGGRPAPERAGGEAASTIPRNAERRVQFLPLENQAAIWLRVRKPSLMRMFSTWVSAVRGEMTSLAAMSRLVIP